MTYNEWLNELKNNLLSVSDAERKRVLDYYAEAYADRREAGFSESEIIDDFGKPYDAAQRILSENGATEEAKGSFTIQTYTAVKDIGEIEIDMSVGPLVTEFYDGDSIQILYPVNKHSRTSIKETCGRLKCKLDYKPDYKKRNFFLKYEKIPKTVIKLPKGKALHFDIELDAGDVTLGDGVYGNLDIEVNAGRLTASDVDCANMSCDVKSGMIKLHRVTCKEMDCDVNTGTVNIDALDCEHLVCDVSAGNAAIDSLSCPDIKAEVRTGKLTIGVEGAKSEYTISTASTLGRCNVSNQTGSTDKKLEAKCAVGSLSVDFRK